MHRLFAPPSKHRAFIFSHSCRDSKVPLLYTMTLRSIGLVLVRDTRDWPGLAVGSCNLCYPFQEPYLKILIQAKVPVLEFFNRTGAVLEYCNQPGASETRTPSLNLFSTPRFRVSLLQPGPFSRRQCASRDC